MDGFQYRIHPDDAHLQYGPVSTELRSAAEHSLTFSPITDYIHKIVLEIDGDLATGGDLHRALFLLILSEALAEEGL